MQAVVALPGLTGLLDSCWEEGPRQGYGGWKRSKNHSLGEEEVFTKPSAEPSHPTHTTTAVPPGQHCAADQPRWGGEQGQVRAM